MTKLSAYSVYLIMSAAAPFLMTTIWVVGAVYYVLSVHMNPLQLVLVGTALEVSYFVFQLPTGLFADTYGRKISVVIGMFVGGACWLFQGLVPVFAAIVVAEVVRGAGAAFIDGAESAWLSDEVGEENFGKVMLRGSQVGQIGGMVGVFAGVALASIRLNLPIALGGVLLMGLGLFLAGAMPEHGFTPAPRKEQSRRQAMRATLRTGVQAVRGRPLLLAILGTAAVFGAFSEGFDRLWEAHFLHNFTFPRLNGFKPVVWFGIINAAVAILNVGMTEVVRRRVDMNSHVAVTRTLFAVEATLIASVVCFGLAGSFGLAVGAFLTARVMRQTVAPVYSAWLNQNVADSRVRATVLSLQGGADSMGQFVGGPIVGAVGTIFSLRAAITAAGLALSPVLPVFAWALRHDRATQEEVEAVPQTP